MKSYFKNNNSNISKNNLKIEIKQFSRNLSNLESKTKQIEPFQFYTYNGCRKNFGRFTLHHTSSDAKLITDFPSYHIITGANLGNIKRFLETNFKFANAINGNFILDKELIELSKPKSCIDNKIIYLTSGVYHDGRKIDDAIIIHTDKENDTEIKYVIDHITDGYNY
ncbi:hypothetical protein Hokovirus_2_196 [Hokovirus HKV1]|uniref:Uncharacterized protein n=1 Tax=Hokovirus HKV1 TaxID=1977638 RepID=A0A1V0SG23_9VIRU|nr:hypothetical protein Hokovirus_2_196 [Hokovirus HKV1]